MKTKKEPLFIEVENKEQFYKDNYPLGDPPAFEDEVICMHCMHNFIVKDFKIERGTGGDGKPMDYILCPKAPDCNGNCMDWRPYDDDAKEFRREREEATEKWYKDQEEKAKANMERKGIKMFEYGDNVIFARNQKNADRKAKNAGYIK